MSVEDALTQLIFYWDARVTRLEWERDTARIIAVVFAIIAAMGWAA